MTGAADAARFAAKAVPAAPTHTAISFLFMSIPPCTPAIPNSSCRTRRGAFAADNAVAVRYDGLVPNDADGPHRTLALTNAAADAGAAVDVHSQRSGNAAPDDVHQAAGRSNRTEKIADAPPALGKQPQDDKPENKCPDKRRRIDGDAPRMRKMEINKSKTKKLQ